MRFARSHFFAVAAVATALASGIAAPQATAAPVHRTHSTVSPMSAQSCSQNVCMYLSTPSNGYVKVEAWAYSNTFYGYFHFTAPLGVSKYAGPTTWYGGKVNYAYIDNPAVVGTYCVHGYLPGPSYYSEGTVCHTVN